MATVFILFALGMSPLCSSLTLLIEEDRRLSRQADGRRRVRLTDDDGRCLAVRAFRVGRQALREIATCV